MLIEKGKLLRILNQSRLFSIRRAIVYQFGYQVPRSVKQALELDKKNGNTKWTDAMALELSQIDEYDTFKDLGRGAKAPAGYKKITVHFVFAVKQDGRHILLKILLSLVKLARD